MICKCLRISCGHEWKTRTEEVPATCPKCKSYVWDKPTINKETIKPKGDSNESKRL